MFEFTNAVQQMLINTPWWVYILFFYLVFKGFIATRSRVVPFKKLFILPLVLLVLSIYGLLNVLNPSISNISFWALALFLGGALGWFQVHRQELLFDKRSHLVKISGTWSVLFLILIIFISKYYFDYSIAINPDAIHHLWFKLTFLGISGICNGLLLGRLLAYLEKMRKAIHTELSI